MAMDCIGRMTNKNSFFARVTLAALPAVAFTEGVTSLVANEEPIPLKLDHLVYSSSFCIFDGYA